MRQTAAELGAPVTTVTRVSPLLVMFLTENVSVELTNRTRPSPIHARHPTGSILREGQTYRLLSSLYLNVEPTAEYPVILVLHGHWLHQKY